MEFVRKIKDVNILFLLKTGIGSAIAIFLSESFGLAYSPSAGIITLLTIQNTKKETFFIALRRLEAFVLAVITAYVMFTSIGYTALAFGGFVFVFVALCILFGLKDGIAMNAVLMTHFLIEEKFNLSLIINEVALLFIGMGIGIVLNLIMPRYQDRIRREQTTLEEEMKVTLRGMGQMLKDRDSCFIHGEDNFTQLDIMLESLLKKAYEDAGNTLLADTKYLVSYLEMRKLQVDVLKDIKKNIDLIPMLLRQTYPIAEFMVNIAECFHELNNVAGLLCQLIALQEHFRKETLPETREEFECRAILFQILKELEYFLLLKRNFILELEKKNMKSYWDR